MLRQLLLLLIPLLALGLGSDNKLLWLLSLLSLIIEAFCLGKRRSWLRYATLLLLLWAAQLLLLLSPELPKAVGPAKAVRKGPAEHFGGELTDAEVKSISVVLPCAEEREHVGRQEVFSLIKLI